MNRRIFSRLLTLAFTISVPACAQNAPEWHDPSPHKIQFVTVEEGIHLEVLDWGGSGRSVILLAGSGNTAHVFDGFAEKLTSFCHVYGITRRGFGASTHAESGYAEQRLSQDILVVLDSLKIASPVLMGHSAAGGEMTRFGNDHSGRISGLVYMDAAGDPTDWPASSPAYMQLYHNLVVTRDPNEPKKPEPDRSSFQAYREWQVKIGEVATPESELRNLYEANPDGSMGKSKSSPAIFRAYGDGAQKRDYSRITVPVLAFFPSKGTAKPDYKTEEHRIAAEQFDAATKAYVDRWKKNLSTAPGGVRIVEMPGANHYLFLSNPEDVIRELKVFLFELNRLKDLFPCPSKAGGRNRPQKIQDLKIRFTPLGFGLVEGLQSQRLLPGSG